MYAGGTHKNYHDNKDCLWDEETIIWEKKSYFLLQNIYELLKLLDVIYTFSINRVPCIAKIKIHITASKLIFLLKQNDDFCIKFILKLLQEKLSIK